jgi:uncharacterized protein involved in type VI secretion and phage assembly
VSGALFESVARIARHESVARALPAVGRVTETVGADGAPADHAATVELRDSGVVLPQVPIAVGVLGFGALPATGDLVVVVFLDGDPNAPVIVGRLYTDATAPPPEANDGQLALGLPAGDAAPPLSLVLATDGTQATLTLGDQQGTVIAVDDQQLKVTVDKVEVTVTKAGGGRLELKAGSTEVTLKQDGDLALKTTGKLKLEGNEVEISGQAKVKISGATLELN